jgi:glutamate synthase domain-containing protein 3
MLKSGSSLGTSLLGRVAAAKAAAAPPPSDPTTAAAEAKEQPVAEQDLGKALNSATRTWLRKKKQLENAQARVAAGEAELAEAQAKVTALRETLATKETEYHEAHHRYLSLDAQKKLSPLEATDLSLELKGCPGVSVGTFNKIIVLQN